MLAIFRLFVPHNIRIRGTGHKQVDKTAKGGTCARDAGGVVDIVAWLEGCKTRLHGRVIPTRSGHNANLNVLRPRRRQLVPVTTKLEYQGM